MPKFMNHVLTAGLAAGAVLWGATASRAVVTPYSCLAHLSKTATGSRVSSPLANYTCSGSTNTASNVTVTVTLSGAASTTSCDENAVPDGSVLSASGVLEHRADGLSQFAGKFTITSPSGTVLFTGTVDLMDRVDAHHPPVASESCSPLNHMEGWIDGASPNNGCLECPTFKIHGLLDASVTPGPGSTAEVVKGTLDGAIERNPSG